MSEGSRQPGVMGRRQVLASAVALAGAAASSRLANGQAATPTGGEWTFTDVLGNTVTLPERRSGSLPISSRRPACGISESRRRPCSVGLPSITPMGIT